MFEYPTISIVIVNLNGRQHLPECLKTIMRLNYPKDKLEIVVVDNGSDDGSTEYLEKKWKNVKLLKNSANEGFAQPSNDGAAAATGDYIVFLNNDMRVDREWLQELVKTVDRTKADCVGSTILSWDGSRIDFIGGGLTFYAKGHQYHYNEPASKVEEFAGDDPEIMFACGGAMLIRKDVFDQVGGFDGDYFAYFEDVDLGWRLWVEGYKVRLSTHSITYHKHNSTSKTFDREKLEVLYERNKLYTAYKNYSDNLLQKLFWPSVLLEMRAICLSSGIDGYAFDMKNPEEVDSGDLKISKISAARMTALNEFLANLSIADKKRKAIQAKRKLADSEVSKFFDEPYVTFPQDSAELVNSEYDIVKCFGVEKTIGHELKLRVMLISNDNVGEKMAGPGIRYWEMAKSLAATGKFDVTLACPNTCDISYKGIKQVSYSISDYSKLLNVASTVNVIMIQGFVLDVMPKLKPIAEKKYVIVDIYDPFMIENIEVYRDKDRGFRDARHKESLESLRYQLSLGDFFICANEKQKDYWIGMLSALNRVTPKLYDVDRSGDKLVAIVPFGVSDRLPEHKKKVLKGVWPGIRETDKVLIWGGGVWNWFDPLTLIKAVKRISLQRDDVKLFFMGVKHPNPAVPQMKMLSDAVALAKDLDIYDKYVFFNFGWVDYNDRQNYLLEADIGVSCHFQTLETRFSFRTRILDYLWANLPIVCTKGDYFSELVEHRKLGKTVDYQDESALATAITELIDDKSEYEDCKRNVSEVAESYRWSRITGPIVDFCEHPIHMGLRKQENTDLTDEEDETYAGAKPRQLRHISRGGGSLMDKVEDLRLRQDELENSVKKIRRQNTKIYDIALELQVWSYMMNDRFNKMKKAFNPLRIFRRLFHRSKA